MFSEVTHALKALLLVVATVVAGCAPALQDTGQVSTVDTAVFVERDLALAYDARTGAWEEAVFSVLSGDELLYDGHLFKVSDDGLVDRGAVELWELYPADAPFDAALDDDALPTSDEWVLIFGDDAESGHRRFGSVQPGERFAYFGRVHATRAAADGVLEVRQTGEVLSEVAATFVRHAAMLLEAELVLEDGSVSTVSATGGHPFYVPAEDTYRPLEELEVGTELRLVGGGTAVVRAITEVPGDVEVFNFEVVGQHNYFAGESGVAVHNAQYKCGWPSWVLQLAAGQIDPADRRRELTKAGRALAKHANRKGDAFWGALSSHKKGVINSEGLGFVSDLLGSADAKWWTTRNGELWGALPDGRGARWGTTSGSRGFIGLLGQPATPGGC